MRPKIILLIAALYVTQLYAQTNTAYVFRDLSTLQELTLSAIVKGEDNFIYTIGTNGFDNFLVKINESAQIVWQKKLNINFNLFDINQISYYNNNIYVLGSDLLSEFTSYNLLKIDINGNLIWAKKLNSLSLFAAYDTPSMVINANAGITVASSVWTNVDLFSLNEDGTTNWIKNYTTDSIESKNPTFDITITENGDIIGCSKTLSDMSFYCIANNGQVKWAKQFLEYGSAYTHVKSIVEINSNKFLLCGYRNANGFYAFMDSVGSFIDFRIVNELGIIKNGIVLNNGNILLNANSLLGSSIYITIDNEGNIIESYGNEITSENGYNTIAESNNYKYILRNSILQKLYNFTTTSCLNFQSQTLTYQGVDFGATPSDNYISTNPPGFIENDTNMQLIESNVQIEVICQETVGFDENKYSEINIFPTIIKNGENIYIKHGYENTLSYTIIDLNGKIIERKPLTVGSISINGLIAGVFIIQLRKENNIIYNSKFVVVE